METDLLQANHLHIGTSGWSYPQWRNGFYPKGIKDRERLGHYAGAFDTVEVNTSFYSLPSPLFVARWNELTPPHFRFCMKVWQEISHKKKLKDCAADIELFHSTIAPLQEKAGPVLLQLPPSVGVSALPYLVETLVRFGEKGWRTAVEFRNTSWYEIEHIVEVHDSLAHHNAAVVLHDMTGSVYNGRFDQAPFFYQRFHGAGIKYGGSYHDRALRHAADTAHQALHSEKEAYIFFNNTMGDALANAASLREMILEGHAPLLQEPESQKAGYSDVTA